MSIVLVHNVDYVAPFYIVEVAAEDYSTLWQFLTVMFVVFGQEGFGIECRLQGNVVGALYGDGPRL
jgi:hypothetical protein